MTRDNAVDLLLGYDVVCREKVLLKAISDNEHIASILANVKISMPGMTKLKQEQKKSKKSSKK